MQCSLWRQTRFAEGYVCEVHPTDACSCSSSFFLLCSVSLSEQVISCSSESMSVNLVLTSYWKGLSHCDLVVLWSNVCFIIVRALFFFNGAFVFLLFKTENLLYQSLFHSPAAIKVVTSSSPSCFHRSWFLLSFVSNTHSCCVHYR